jgi:hypothetical protein
MKPSVFARLLGAPFVCVRTRANCAGWAGAPTRYSFGCSVKVLCVCFVRNMWCFSDKFFRYGVRPALNDLNVVADLNKTSEKFTPVEFCWNMERRNVCVMPALIPLTVN